MINVITASKIIKDGGVVIFPTETVYGIGANCFDEDAVRKIFDIKGRPNDNPLICHISSFEMLPDLVDEEFFKTYKNKIEKLCNAFWPGPLSLVVKKSAKVPDVVTANLDTVAIRMPNHHLALELIKRAGVPISAPSANISGRPSTTREIDVLSEFKGKVPNILVDDSLINKSTYVGIESTVLDITKEPTVLRQGAVSASQISNVLGTNVLSKAESEKPMSPGQKYKHYSPNAKVILILTDDVQSEFIKQVSKYGAHQYFLTIDEGEHKEKAKTLYADFRDADRQGKTKIIVILKESKDPFFLPLLDRITRASK